MSRAEVAQQYENGAIYVLLFSRGAQPGFHWAIWVPSATPNGNLWHAVNRSGGWELEIRKSYKAPESMSLCLALKVGTTTDWNTFSSTVEAVPADGRPSRNGEKFSCRTWVEDALYDLHVARVIELTQTIAELERRAVDAAEFYRETVEGGTGSAGVVNDL